MSVADNLLPLVRDLLTHTLYRSGLTRPGRLRGDWLTVVTFHRVLPDEQRAQYPIDALVVTPEELAFCLDFFTEHFVCGPLTEIYERFKRHERAERPLLAVTFDDGQLDNFLHARPVLNQKGVRATFFLPVEYVGEQRALWHDRVEYALPDARSKEPDGLAELLKHLSLEPREAGGAVPALKRLTPDERNAWIERLEQLAGGPSVPEWDGVMNWPQVEAMHADGHEMGSHSMSHPILPRCSDAEILYEVGQSKKRLQEVLGTECSSFCYPNGDADSRTVAAVRDAGYGVAVTTRWGLNTPASAPLELKRCDLHGDSMRTRDGSLSQPRLAFRISPLQPRVRDA